MVKQVSHWQKTLKKILARVTAAYFDVINDMLRQVNLRIHGCQ